MSLSGRDGDGVEEPVKVITPEEEEKHIVNVLIERIREIQSELPEHAQAVTVQAVNNVQAAHAMTRHLHSNNTNYH